MRAAAAKEAATILTGVETILLSRLSQTLTEAKLWELNFAHLSTQRSVGWNIHEKSLTPRNADPSGR